MKKKETPTKKGKACYDQEKIGRWKLDKGPKKGKVKQTRANQKEAVGKQGRKPFLETRDPAFDKSKSTLCKGREGYELKWRG